MRIKWYQSDIIERFMTEVEQAEFDRKYNESKLVTLGRSGLVREKRRRSILDNPREFVDFIKSENKDMINKGNRLYEIGEIKSKISKLQARLDQLRKDEDDTCACGGVRLPHSDFCRDCI